MIKLSDTDKRIVMLMGMNQAQLKERVAQAQNALLAITAELSAFESDYQQSIKDIIERNGGDFEKGTWVLDDLAENLIIKEAKK